MQTTPVQTTPDDATPVSNVTRRAPVLTADDKSTGSRWLTVPEVADVLGVGISDVRRMVRDRQLLAVRRADAGPRCVPSGLLGANGPLPDLPGTLTVLADAGLSDDEAWRWLVSTDPTIPGGSPLAALRAGHKTEVRRRAQALAL
ncbi:MAG: Rv2175c family DNA-binding protein [Angustibacter sp.]